MTNEQLVKKLAEWRANRDPGGYYCKHCGGRIVMLACGEWVLYADPNDDICDDEEKIMHEPEPEEIEDD